jgi:hypothetical protein
MLDVSEGEVCRMRVMLPFAVMAMMAGCGNQEKPAPTQPQAKAPMAKDWPAVEHCLGLIRQCQMPDGMIRMKSEGDAVWMVSYFSNLGAIALLAANEIRPNAGDVARAERWLAWYARHQETDGTIFDREGTTRSHQSNGKRDATDSYAATFLLAAWRYQQASGQRPSAEIIKAAQKSLAAIEAVAQADGLTIAKPEYAIKFLMDNIEVHQGLTEGAQFFDSVGLKTEARKARTMAARLAGSLGQYWSEPGQHFAYALDLKGNFSSGLAEPYPHGLAQLFALSYLSPARPGLWAKVNLTFKPDQKGIPVERWLIAATRHAGAKEKEVLRLATRKSALNFSRKNVYVERPAMAVLALIDGKARFAEVPMPQKK